MAVGQIKAIQNNMSNKTKYSKQKLQHIVNLLKFILTLNNEEEIVKATIEQAVELLEEEINV